MAGRTSFSVRSVRKGGDQGKQYLHTMENSIFSGNPYSSKQQNTEEMGRLDPSLRPPTKPRLGEKPPVLISFNCSKAISIPDYEKLCEIMEPVRTKLQERSLTNAINVEAKIKDK